MRPFNIRHITVNPGLVLAPMSGVTTSAFRRLIKELNPHSVGLVISEFISVEGLTRESRRSAEMMRYRECERPFGIQIFGYDIQRMRDAAVMVEQSGADLVDINCGCPAPKVVKKGGGCELMRQPQHLAQIVREVKKSISIPLTMKIRSGWDEQSLNAMEIAKMAEGEGVEALAIHGRTRAQLYRGEADWNIVGEVARTLKIPVLGSGDVVDSSTAAIKLQSGAAGLYIGRAALYNPFVFSEIVTGKANLRKKDESLVLSVLERYAELLLEDFAPRSCVGRFKQLVSQYCRGFNWRKEICTTNTLEEQLAIIKRLRENPSYRTDLNELSSTIAVL